MQVIKIIEDLLSEIKFDSCLKNIDSKELVLVLEVDTSHAESLLSSFTDWEDVKLEKDLVERSRYIVARK